MVRHSRFTFACVFVLSCVIVEHAIAAPYLPTSDAQVLETLPFRPGDPVAREIAQLRSALQRNPRDLDSAVKLARRYYGLVAEEGDPRYLGYAQAALGPWWALPQPPIPVQILRASLAQFRHDFKGAIEDLNSVLIRDPSQSQARVLRATLHIVQARYDQARADCQSLKGVRIELVAIGCTAMVDGLTGKAPAAYETLLLALRSHTSATKEEKLWVDTRLAEMAQRLGRYDDAENHFRDALNLGITDTFLLAAYADFLLLRNRPLEVEAMLKARVRSDSLLLRLVLAEHMLKRDGVFELEATLAARYAAAQMRHDTVHQQEEAQFELKVRANAARALALAQENWKIQLEPRDAEIFLQAALVLKNPEAARPVLQWMRINGVQDQVLASLAKQIEGLQP